LGGGGARSAESSPRSRPGDACAPRPQTGPKRTNFVGARLACEAGRPSPLRLGDAWDPHCLQIIFERIFLDFGAAGLAPPTRKLHPIQRALAVQPHIPKHQDSQKREHADQQAQRSQIIGTRCESCCAMRVREINRPRKKKNCFHIENHKQNRHNIKSHRIPRPRVALRRNPALIRFQLRAKTSRRRTNQLEQKNRHRGKRRRQRSKNKYRYVFSWHSESHPDATTAVKPRAKS
jgi:hypothetical protein